jgi:transcriptional regulator with XRE-family HTH domain
VNSQEQQFFKDLGTRIAQARRDHGLTQQELADHLGLAQQTFAHYEMGRVRFPASILPLLGEILGMTPEELLGQVPQPKPRKGPTPRILQQLERISQLPKTKQHIVSEMLEMVLAQTGS